MFKFLALVTSWLGFWPAYALGANFPAGWVGEPCSGVCYTIALGGGLLAWECDVPPGAAGGEGYMVTNYPGHAYDNYSAWGYDGDGNKWACYYDDSADQVFEFFLMGTDDADTLMFHWNSGAIYLTQAGATANFIYGNGGDDLIHGSWDTSATDVDCGGGSTYKEWLSGNGGVDVIYGNPGNDCIYGNADADQLMGNDGDDIFDGGLGADTIQGNAGDDWLYGYDGDDVLFGGSGADHIYGEADNDTLKGEDGDDYLYGGAGNDAVCGGDGANTLYAVGGGSGLPGQSHGQLVRAFVRVQRTGRIHLRQCQYLRTHLVG